MLANLAPPGSRPGRAFTPLVGGGKPRASGGPPLEDVGDFLLTEQTPLARGAPLTPGDQRLPTMANPAQRGGHPYSPCKRRRGRSKPRCAGGDPRRPGDADAAHRKTPLRRGSTSAILGTDAGSPADRAQAEITTRTSTRTTPPTAHLATTGSAKHQKQPAPLSTIQTLPLGAASTRLRSWSGPRTMR